MDAKYLKDWENELNICIRCAYCFEGCPIFKTLGWESDGARGKAILAHGLLTGKLEPSRYIADKIFTCTYCRDCVERCSANVSIPGILAAARADLVEVGFASDTHKVMLENVKKTGNIFGDTEVDIPVQKGKVTVFIGCQYLARPNQTKLYLRILKKLGIEPTVREEICCGYPLYALGFRKEFNVWKDKFLKLFPEDEMIALCPTCAAFLHEEYDKKIKHVTQVILEHLPEAHLGIKVTYHDPCDLSRALNIIDEPREILQRLGVELIEMDRSKKTSYCCGGGGGLLMSNVEVSDKVAEVRIKQAIATGADMLVTPCPTCEQVLKKAAAVVAEDGGDSIAVRNLSDLVWKAIR